jgi:hypothetical protein
MKIRVQRSLLADSMETVQDIVPTVEDIATYLRVQWGGLGYGVHADRITVEPYCYDERINWNTHLVCLDGKAVAFTDGPIRKKVLA